jgi:cell division FtsZ-interacting protein ZapD
LSPLPSATVIVLRLCRSSASSGYRLSFAGTLFALDFVID